VAAEDSRV